MTSNTGTNLDLVATGYDELLKGAFVDGRALLERARAQGDLRASPYLGWVHEDGLGVKRDAELAVRYYEEALANGDVSVCSRLSRVLQGLNRHAEAICILEQGAKAGDGQATYNLGYLLSDQSSEFYSPDRAAEFLVGIASNNPFACRRLAALHFSWRLTNSSYLLAVRHLLCGAKLLIALSRTVAEKEAR